MKFLLWFFRRQFDVVDVEPLISTNLAALDLSQREGGGGGMVQTPEDSYSPWTHYSCILFTFTLYLIFHQIHVAGGG